MKRIITISAVLLLIFSSTSMMAQFKVGGGLTLGSKMGLDDDLSEKMGFGINIRGDLGVTDKLSIAPGFTYFFPGAPDGYDLSAWQLNADAHYTFAGLADNISVYGIAGLNYSHTKTEIDGLGDLGDAFDDLGDAFGLDMDFDISGDDSDNELGFDLGVGASMSKFYGEIKYDTSFDGQIAISVGILF